MYSSLLNTEIEIWKDIPRFEGYYQASNLGNIRRVKGGKGTKNKNSKPFNLRGATNRRGYRVVVLCRDRVRYPKLWHRLIALTFMGASDLQVNHMNGAKLDNRVSNLEYVTNVENKRHAMSLGLVLKGEQTVNSKLTNKDVTEIKKLLLSGNTTQEVIGTMFGVSRSCISQIANKSTWAHHV